MSYLYVANWKMNMHAHEALRFCTENYNELLNVSKNTDNIIILCPSFVALFPIAQLLQKTPILIGAQNCSSHKSGAYTGEVSAQSLAEIGCNYCIIGHSERRTLFNETNDSVAQKLTQLLNSNIQPIICIGETKDEYLNEKTHDIVTAQLLPIFEILTKHKKKENKHIVIAYEPVWSIGTGIIPDIKYLKTVFGWLRTIIEENIPHHSTLLLYGGSVDSQNITQLKQIKDIQGFLVGGASTNFEKFKALMQSSSE